MEEESGEQRTVRRPRARSLSLGELIALRLLLRNVNESLAEASAATTLAESRLGVRAAQVSLKTALELTTDPATL